MAASAENTATFAIDFNAQGAKSGVDAAAGSLEKLRTQIDEDTAALGAMQKAFKNLQGGTSVNIQAFQNLKKQIEAKKATISQTQARFLELGGTFRKTKKPTDDTADALKTLFERMQKGGGPVGGLAGRLQGLRGLLAGGGALVVGAVALAGVLVVIAGAAIAAAAALLKYGLAAADAYRSERLQLEGLTKVRNWYGIAAGKAEDLQAAIDNVSGSVALGRDQIGGLEKNLYRAGFRGAALEEALLGVSTATAAAGEEQGAFAQQMYMAMGRSAAGMKKVSGDLKARFGGVAAAQMLSLGVQSKKLKESFDGLFRGLKLEGFLGGLKSITDLFSQSTASGRALRAILETAMQPLIDMASKAAPFVKRFFQGMILAALDLMIAYYDLRIALKGVFGGTDLLKNVDGLTLALSLGKAAVYTMAVWLGLCAAAVALVAAPFVLASAALVSFGYAVYRAWNFVSEINWGELGSALVDGFVNGIKNKITSVVNAVKQLGATALETLRHALDSHSPSRKGFSLGITYPQGVAVGIQRETPRVQKASERLGAAVEYGAQKNMPDGGSTPFAANPTPSFTPQIEPMPVPRASGGGAPTLQLPAINITINVDGKEAPRETAEAVLAVCDQQIRSTLERVAASLRSAEAA